MTDSIEQERAHHARVETVTAEMPSDEDLAIVGARFKLLGEVCRLKILASLKEGELCVDHISAATGANQSATSHQLRILKDNGFVKSRREGKSVLYSLADRHVEEMLEMGMEHVLCHKED